MRIIKLSFSAAESVDCLPPLSQNLTFSQLLLGRVPQGHADYLIVISLRYDLYRQALY